MCGAGGIREDYVVVRINGFTRGVYTFICRTSTISTKNVQCVYTHTKEVMRCESY